MSGLEKIQERILRDAKRTAEETICEAKAKADAIKQKAGEEAERQSETVSLKLNSDIANYKDRVNSSIELERRNRISAAKQDIISGIIEKAKLRFSELPDEEYFNMLLELLKNHIKAEEGQMYLSEKDLNRITDDFKDRVAHIAESKNTKLSIAENPGKIKSGFVLVYGGIEENCTPDALFEDKKDVLSDLVQKKLF